MSTNYPPDFDQLAVDNDGKPLTGGYIKAFYTGTSNDAPTYNSSETLNPVDIPINIYGRYQMRLDTAITYDILFYSAAGGDAIRTYPAVSVGGGTGGGSSTVILPAHTAQANNYAYESTAHAVPIVDAISGSDVTHIASVGSVKDGLDTKLNNSGNDTFDGDLTVSGFVNATAVKIAGVEISTLFIAKDGYLARTILGNISAITGTVEEIPIENDLSSNSANVIPSVKAVKDSIGTIKIDSTDNAGFAASKIVAGDRVSIEITGEVGNRQLVIAADPFPENVVYQTGDQSVGGVKTFADATIESDTGVMLPWTPFGGVQKWLPIATITTDDTGSGAWSKSAIAALRITFRGVAPVSSAILEFNTTSGGNWACVKNVLTTGLINSPYMFAYAGSDGTHTLYVNNYNSTFDPFLDAYVTIDYTQRCSVQLSIPTIGWLTSAPSGVTYANMIVDRNNLVTGVLTLNILAVASLTASQLVASDANKTLVSLPVATYPSLAELAFLKGLTSSAQTQLNARLPLAGGTLTGDILLHGGRTIGSDTADGSDDSFNVFAGGLTADPARGAYLSVRGNDRAVTGGRATVAGGSGVDGSVELVAGSTGSIGTIDLYTGGVLREQITKAGLHTIASLTASTILATGASKELVSLPVATYPSLAELAFVKGLTSAVQTQVNRHPRVVQSTNTTAGNIAWDLASGEMLDITNALTGNVTINITNPIAGGESVLTLTQPSTPHYFTLSMAGVVFRRTGTTFTATDAIDVAGVSTANCFYKITLTWVTGLLCYVSVS